MINRDFKNLKNETFDLVVVGGGIIGSGIARDAALRGIKTLLIDKEDFSYGTTATSSRLIHGGLRYLRQFDFGLVRQDMREREILLKTAPHLVSPLPFLIPMTGRWERIVMAFGMRLYDLLSFDKSVPSYQHLSRHETLDMEPDLNLDGLIGSYLFYDCKIPFAERLCLENVLSAAENGAAIANHARLTGIPRAGEPVQTIEVEDTLSGDICRINARLIVNAAGPWMDIVYDMLGTGSPPVMRRTKGIHLVTDKLTNNAMVLFSRSDGRLFFIIPWEDYSLVGTTDTDYQDDSDAVHADVRDVDYLLTELRRSFPSIKEKGVYYTFAGLRALAGSKEGRASNVSRSHKLIDHEKADGIKGFISIVGGKITGFRGISEEVVDLVSKKLGVTSPCITAQLPLPGAPDISRGEIEQAAKTHDVSLETVAHLNRLYGSRLHQVLEMADEDVRGKLRLCEHSPDIVAQVWHATRIEGALTVSDFMLRRGITGLVSCQGLDAVAPVAEEMGKILGWSPEDKQKYIEEYRYRASLGRRFATDSI